MELLGEASRDVARAHWAPREVPRVSAAGLSEASFLRDFVAPSRPVVLLGATAHWRAHASWGGDDWRERLASLSGDGAETEVNVTPTGRGDAVASTPEGEEVFVASLSKRLPLREALALVCGNDGGGGGGSGGGGGGGVAGGAGRSRDVCRCSVRYLSGQNDNVRRQLPGLLADLGGDAGCGVASAALGTGAEAVNLWIGSDERIVSTTHKDSYENLVTVIRGVKRFCLLPPCDVLWLSEKVLPMAAYEHDDALCSAGGGGEACWRIARDAGGARVPWLRVDPEAPDLSRFPLFANASPVVVDVRAGETLYLPALWHHQVSHPARGVTIAVNTWRDMDYMSGTYASYSLLRAAARLTTRED